MDQNGLSWVDGDRMHRVIAGRVGRQPRRLNWREARDLSWVATMSTAAPLAALALHAGVSPSTTLGLTAMAAFASLWVVRTLRREYPLSVNATVLGSAYARSRTASLSTRWRSAALRLVPARHRLAPARRTRLAQPKSRRPGA